MPSIRSHWRVAAVAATVCAMSVLPLLFIKPKKAPELQLEDLLVTQDLLARSEKNCATQTIDVEKIPELWPMTFWRLMQGKSQAAYYDVEWQDYLYGILSRLSRDKLLALLQRNVTLCIDQRLKERSSFFSAMLWNDEGRPFLSLSYHAYQPFAALVLDRAVEMWAMDRLSKAAIYEGKIGGNQLPEGVWERVTLSSLREETPLLLQPPRKRPGAQELR